MEHVINSEAKLKKMEEDFQKQVENVMALWDEMCSIANNYSVKLRIYNDEDTIFADIYDSEKIIRTLDFGKRRKFNSNDNNYFRKRFKNDFFSNSKLNIASKNAKISITNYLKSYKFEEEEFVCNLTQSPMENLTGGIKVVGTVTILNEEPVEICLEGKADKVIREIKDSLKSTIIRYFLYKEDTNYIVILNKLIDYKLSEMTGLNIESMLFFDEGQLLLRCPELSSEDMYLSNLQTCFNSYINQNTKTRNLKSLIDFYLNTANFYEEDINFSKVGKFYKLLRSKQSEFLQAHKSEVKTFLKHIDSYKSRFADEVDAIKEKLDVSIDKGTYINLFTDKETVYRAMKNEAIVIHQKADKFYLRTKTGKVKQEFIAVYSVEEGRFLMLEDYDCYEENTIYESLVAINTLLTSKFIEQTNKLMRQYNDISTYLDIRTNQPVFVVKNFFLYLNCTISKNYSYKITSIKELVDAFNVLIKEKQNYYENIEKHYYDITQVYYDNHGPIIYSLINDIDGYGRGTYVDILSGSKSVKEQQHLSSVHYNALGEDYTKEEIMDMLDAIIEQNIFSVYYDKSDHKRRYPKVMINEAILNNISKVNEHHENEFSDEVVLGNSFSADDIENMSKHKLILVLGKTDLDDMTIINLINLLDNEKLIKDIRKHYEKWLVTIPNKFVPILQMKRNLIASKNVVSSVIDNVLELKKNV